VLLAARRPLAWGARRGPRTARACSVRRGRSRPPARRSGGAQLPLRAGGGGGTPPRRLRSPAGSAGRGERRRGAWRLAAASRSSLPSRRPHQARRHARRRASSATTMLGAPRWALFPRAKPRRPPLHQDLVLLLLLLLPPLLKVQITHHTQHTQCGPCCWLLDAYASRCIVFCVSLPLCVAISLVC